MSKLRDFLRWKLFFVFWLFYAPLTLVVVLTHWSQFDNWYGIGGTVIAHGFLIYSLIRWKIRK